MAKCKALTGSAVKGLMCVPLHFTRAVSLVMIGEVVAQSRDAIVLGLGSSLK